MDNWEDFEQVDDWGNFEEVLPEYKKMTFGEMLKASPEELNENVKALGRQQIQQRQDWEQKHPIISGIQRDWQPNYRANLLDMQNRAKYGSIVPIGQKIKTDVQKLGLNAIPSINYATALLTQGMGNTGTLLNMAKGQSAQGAIQGAVEGFMGGLADTGSPIEGLKRGLAGAGIGVGTGIAQPLGTKILLNSIPGVKEQTVKAVIRPNSKALDLTDEEANRLLNDTTERFRTDYKNLKNKKSAKVGEEAKKLTGSDKNIPISELKKDIQETFDNYSTGRVNSARANTGELEQNLYEQIDNIPDVVDNITPYELVGLRRQIGDQINWNDEKIRGANKILSKVYNKFNDRLDTISPSLTQANKEYAELANLLNEKSRLRTILNPKADLETATSKMRNYKSTNDNIYRLENDLIAEGNAPYLVDIDEANLAKELNESLKTGWNILGVGDKLKEIYSRPALNLARGLNRAYGRLPEQVQQISAPLQEVLRRGLNTGGLNAVAPLLLQGGIQYNDQR
jgi:hypothetical protein